jgi:hypothetical protein
VQTTLAAGQVGSAGPWGPDSLAMVEHYLQGLNAEDAANAHRRLAHRQYMARIIPTLYGGSLQRSTSCALFIFSAEKLIDALM